MPARSSRWRGSNDLLGNPQHPYTLALLAASSDPDASNALVMREVPPGEPPSLVNPPAGCRFHPRCAFKIDGVCDVDVPPSFVTEPAHRVACWLFDPEREGEEAFQPGREGEAAFQPGREEMEAFQPGGEGQDEAAFQPGREGQDEAL